MQGAQARSSGTLSSQVQGKSISIRSCDHGFRAARLTRHSRSYPALLMPNHHKEGKVPILDLGQARLSAALGRFSWQLQKPDPAPSSLQDVSDPICRLIARNRDDSPGAFRDTAKVPGFGRAATTCGAVSGRVMGSRVNLMDVSPPRHGTVCAQSNVDRAHLLSLPTVFCCRRDNDCSLPNLHP
jgi:hypothetical protein